MIKDLLASMNDIYSDSNLNLKEKSILMYLIKQFNIKYNYAYPKYKISCLELELEEELMLLMQLSL